MEKPPEPAVLHPRNPIAQPKVRELLNRLLYLVDRPMPDAEPFARKFRETLYELRLAIRRPKPVHLRTYRDAPLYFTPVPARRARRCLEQLAMGGFARGRGEARCSLPEGHVGGHWNHVAGVVWGLPMQPCRAIFTNHGDDCELPKGHPGDHANRWDHWANNGDEDATRYSPLGAAVDTTPYPNCARCDDTGIEACPRCHEFPEKTPRCVRCAGKGEVRCKCHAAHAGHGTSEETEVCPCVRTTEWEMCAEAGCAHCAGVVWGLPNRAACDSKSPFTCAPCMFPKGHPPAVPGGGHIAASGEVWLDVPVRVSGATWADHEEPEHLQQLARVERSLFFCTGKLSNEGAITTCALADGHPGCHEGKDPNKPTHWWAWTTPPADSGLKVGQLFCSATSEDLGRPCVLPGGHEGAHETSLGDAFLFCDHRGPAVSASFVPLEGLAMSQGRGAVVCCNRSKGHAGLHRTSRYKVFPGGIHWDDIGQYVRMDAVPPEPCGCAWPELHGHHAQCPRREP